MINTVRQQKFIYRLKDFTILFTQRCLSLVLLENNVIINGYLVFLVEFLGMGTLHDQNGSWVMGYC